MKSAFEAFSRRDLLKLSAAGFLGGSAAPWFNTLAAHAAEAKAPAKRKSCIMLWLRGGPSQLETFDMKPGHANAGEFKPIPTAVPGIEICELMPKLAKHAKKLALLRSMSTSEADHVRGSYMMQAGYRSIAGPQHPHLGPIASAELGQADFELPNFFWLECRRRPVSASSALATRVLHSRDPRRGFPQHRMRPAVERLCSFDKQATCSISSSSVLSANITAKTGSSITAPPISRRRG